MTYHQLPLDHGLTIVALHDCDRSVWVCSHYGGLLWLALRASRLLLNGKAPEGCFGPRGIFLHSKYYYWVDQYQIFKFAANAADVDKLIGLICMRLYGSVMSDP